MNLQPNSEFKHTPEPWKIHRPGECGFNINEHEVWISGEKNWYGFAKVIVRLDDEKENDIQGEANARLIVAAPKLLKACVQALAYVDADEGASARRMRAVLNEAIEEAK